VSSLACCIYLFLCLIQTALDFGLLLSCAVYFIFFCWLLLFSAACLLTSLVKHKCLFCDASFAERSNSLAAEHVSVLGSGIWLTCGSQMFNATETEVDLYGEIYNTAGNLDVRLLIKIVEWYQCINKFIELIANDINSYLHCLLWVSNFLFNNVLF